MPPDFMVFLHFQGIPEVDPAVLKYRAPTVTPIALAIPATAALPRPVPVPPTADTSPSQIPHVPAVSGPITANPEQVGHTGITTEFQTL